MSIWAHLGEQVSWTLVRDDFVNQAVNEQAWTVQLTEGLLVVEDILDESFSQATVLKFGYLTYWLDGTYQQQKHYFEFGGEVASWAWADAATA